MTDPAFTNAINALSQLQVVAESTGGYYAKLRESGIPEDAAATMAQEYHSALMQMLAAQMLAKAAPGGLRKAR